ncbi:MAG: hypothetical protein RSC68_32480, partial [Acinetobacter sp.]
FATTDALLLPHTMVDIPLGFGLELPLGYAGYIIERGSTGSRGLMPISNPIDPGYRGEIHAKIWNVSSNVQTIEKGERIAQLVIKPYVKADFVYITQSEASGTERGTGAYGSTGKE